MSFLRPDKPYTFVEWRLRGYIFSAALMLLFIAGTLIGGGFKMGIDFVGGTSVTVKFDRAVDNAMLAELRQLLEPKGLSGNIRTIGGAGSSAEEAREISIDVRGTHWADQMVTRFEEARTKQALTVDDLNRLYKDALQPRSLEGLRSLFLPSPGDTAAPPMHHLASATHIELSEIFQQLFNENIALDVQAALSTKYAPRESGREFDINNVGNTSNLAATLAELKRRQAEAAIAEKFDSTAASADSAAMAPRPWHTVDEFLKQTGLDGFDGPSVRRELYDETRPLTGGVSVLTGSPADLSKAFVISFANRFLRNAEIVTSHRDRDFGGLYPSIDVAASKSPADDPEMRQLLGRHFYAGRFIIASSETVGAAVGKDLMWAALSAILISMLGIVVYVWFRFELRYGIGAIASLLHDTLLTLGLIGFMHIEFSIPIVAAILTIMGYSINDTIVVYDRIREKVGKLKGTLDPHIIDLAITETLSRTTGTAGTTIISIVAFLIFGPVVTRDLSFALTFGIFIGTFSSIFVAAPILVEWERFSAKKK